MAATNTVTNLAEQVAIADDIRDIRPLTEIPNPWIWLWMVLAGLAVAALILWLWRRSRNQKELVPAIPPVPAHVRARQRLTAALDLIGDPKAFTIAVSDALRFYLEDAFELRAPERTTEEFLKELPNSAMLSTAQKTSLRDFLESCDMVKFAKYEPRESELRELHSYALELVSQTEPAPEPATGTAPSQDPPAGETAATTDRPS
jgi:hypothetical protein